jgi:adenylate kinase family enzyme
VHSKGTGQQAVLLVGPTGSGKTPLGEWLEVHGLWGRRCHHFDFGANLRAVASGQVEGFTPEEVRFIRDVIEQGALLEKETFHLALRILQAYMSSRRVHPDDLLIMNGLPRHVGQSEAIAPYLEFVAIIDLQCRVETVCERLHRNMGGDRADRTDDAITLVQQKLAVFTERTRPLLAFYRQRGVPLMPVIVGVYTMPPELVEVLEHMRPSAGRRDQEF